MSLFRSGGSSNSHKPNATATLQERLAAAVNQCRAKPSIICEWLDRVAPGTDWKNSATGSSRLGEAYSRELRTQIEDAKRYCLALAGTLAELPSLHFSQRQSEELSGSVIDGINSPKGFRNKNRFAKLRTYKCVQQPSAEATVAVLALHQYLQLSKRAKSAKEKESRAIPLLSGNFSHLFVHLAGNMLEIGFAAVQPENALSIFSQVASNLNQTTAESTALKPRPQSSWNYEYIPMAVVEKLFLKLDTDKNNLVGQGDLRREFQRLHTDLTSETIASMMTEARQSRPILFEQDRLRDISLRQLYCVVQVRKIRKNGTQVALPHTTSDYWRKLFRVIGVDYEKPSPTLSSSGKSGNIRVKNLPNRPDYEKRCPEIGFGSTLNSTISFVELGQTKPVDDSGKLSTILNGNINKIEDQPTITFQTRQLFDREFSAQRLKLTWLPR